jgi:hypothetical protein
LSEDGAIVLNDVLTHAAPDWKTCKRICRALGYDWEIDADISQGAAIVPRGGRARPRARTLLLGVEAHARWRIHAAILGTRRAAGRALRRAGLR